MGLEGSSQDGGEYSREDVELPLKSVDMWAEALLLVGLGDVIITGLGCAGVKYLLD